LSISDRHASKEENVMKSFVSTLSALSIALFLVGCGGAPADTDGGDTAVVGHEEPAPAEGHEEEAPAEGEGEAAPAEGEAAPAEGEKAAE
jgi:hypothetical protein